MQGYIMRRVVLVFPTLVIVSFLVFFLVRVMPGDYVHAKLGDIAYTPQEAQDLRHRLGLDRPIYRQYAIWIGGILRGDLGESLITRESVRTELGERLEVTLELGALSLMFTVLIGAPIGVLAAVRRDSLLDYVLRSAAILGLAVPGFWIAIVVLVYASIWFGWSPPIIYHRFTSDPANNMQQFLLPAAIMALGTAAVVMRMTRSMVLEVLGQDYIRTARAKGLREVAVLVRHALRNALIPVVTVVGVSVASLLGGTVIFENIFALPGVGRYMIQAVAARDYPVIEGVSLALTVGIVLVNLFVDVSYSLLDPRIRFRTEG
jgi:peptide/nickel transport system permease protein